VRVLELVGAETVVQTLRALGVALDRSGDWYGPALALGSADVTLWELVGAYRALARGGAWSPLRLAPDTASAPRRVISEDAAFVVGHVLADRESRSATFGLENVLATPFWTAVKTGTSKDMRDNWCIGFSRRYTVGVWVGNFSGEPMHNVSGVTGAAPVWVDVMRALHRTEPSVAPSPPPGVVPASVGFGGSAEPPRRDWFLRGTEPVEAMTAAHRARIVAPTTGTIIALDPEIPAARQRVIFEATHADPDLRWLLDGADLGPARQPVLWPPDPGHHTLTLLAPTGPRDTVRFEVRGQALTSIHFGGQRE
jgi:penicillin-binding protein 1C